MNLIYKICCWNENRQNVFAICNTNLKKLKSKKERLAKFNWQE